MERQTSSAGDLILLATIPVCEESMTYWVVFCLDTQERDTNGKHGISGSGITVIRSFSGVAPAWALQGAVNPR
jgi:hypothetical protein